jgi:peptide/nickel transport system substrate-binding protein
MAFGMALALVTALASCGSKDNEGEGGGGGLKKLDVSTLATIVTADKPAKLDPHSTKSGSDVKILLQVYQQLLQVNPINVDELVPELATKWVVSEDGQLITFTIREGVTFHDGEKLDAKACALSLSRVMGFPFNGQVYATGEAPYRSEYEAIETVEGTGLTLKVKLKRPAARVMLRNLAMFPASIVSPRLIASTSGKPGAEATSMVSANPSGTGPYMTKGFVPNAGTVTLTAFDANWKAPNPAIKTLIFKQESDGQKRFESLKSGEVHVVDDIPRALWKDASAQMTTWWALNCCYLGLNTGQQKTPRPFLTADVRIRKAIQLCVDRDRLNEAYYETARPTYSLLAQPHAEYDKSWRAKGTDANRAARVAAARKLVEEAEAVGKTVTIYYPKDDRPYLPQATKIADLIRQSIAECGLDVKIESTENEVLFTGVKDGKWEIVLIGWMSDNGDPDNFYGPLAGGDKATRTPGENNASQHYDDRIVALTEEGAGILDLAKRSATYREIEKILQEEIVGWVPLVNTKQGIAFGPTITGVEVDPLGHYRFHAAKLTK